MKKGFSLVELSVVLVILGLLTGGILAGQSLIRAATLRSVTSDMNRWKTATQSFRDKYNMLPGDMINAVNYWGQAAHCPGTAAQPSTDTSTCNGDGNWQITSTGTSYENFRYWQQLANAGLIEGSFTGVTGSAGTDNAVPGQNVPQSRISSAGYMVEYLGNLSGSAYWVDGAYGHQMRMGLQGTGWTNAPALKPEEMWNIDTKMDDGMPLNGVIYSEKASGQANCATTDLPATAVYAVNTTGLSCTLFFKTGF